MPEEIKATLSKDGVLIDNSTGSVVDSRTLKASNVFITDIDKEYPENLAKGIAINKYRKTSWEYIDAIKDFDYRSGDIYQYMKTSNVVYTFEQIIGTAIDVFAEFCTTDFSIKGVDDKTKNILNYFKNNVNNIEPNKNSLYVSQKGLLPLINEIALEWFISGNIFPYAVWDRVNVEGTSYLLPVKIFNLNPQSIKIDRYSADKGNDSIDAIGNVKYTYRGISDEDILSNEVTYRSYTNYLEQMKTIDHRFLYHIKRKSRSFYNWGIPYLTRCFSAVKHKRTIRLLEESTIEGLVNYLIIFKIGSTDPDSPFHKPSQARLTAFSNLIANPQASNMIVWPHDVEVITVGPDGKVLELGEKYKNINDDIIKSLGIPQVLLDATGSLQTSWVGILSLIERLEKVRMSVALYLESMFKQIIVANKSLNKDQDPLVKWSFINLRDEKAVKTLILAFYDRGLLPVQTTLSEGGYSYDDLLEIKKEEKKKNINELFARPDIPFAPNPNKDKMGDPNKDRKFNPSEGRPGDNIKTDKEGVPVTKSSINNDFIGYLKDSSFKIFDDLETGMLSTKYTNEVIKNSTLIAMTRLQENFDIYISSLFDSNNYFSKTRLERDDPDYTNLIKWKNDRLNELGSFIISETISNTTKNKSGSKDIYIIRGILSDARSKLKTLCDTVFYYVDIALKSKQARSDRFVYAKISINNDSNNNFNDTNITVSIDDIFSKLTIDNIKNSTIEFIPEVK